MTVAIDSRGIAESYLDWVRAEVSSLARTPSLATILCRGADNPGSRQYRDMIQRDAQRLGIRATDVEAAGERDVVARIAELNADPATDGIVVFYPVGGERADSEIMDLVSPGKDIEGLHSINLGYLIKYRRFLDEARGIKCVVPATAKAVVKTLQHYPDIRIEGAFVTIVNNSMRVGKPLGLMLENLGATVVKCYDRTRREDLEACVRRADVVVTAVPDPAFRLEPSWIKAGAAVVDVSYGGNVDSAALEGRAAYASPPDNRVGRMTRAMTLVNLVYCARRSAAGI
ncbi:MAG TPA: bifunctional 5,10-methylenetetrahydrofolate dehydrogenase/5,10-methenyltetrahydrofolate cyclohydrolase [Elusimicrobiota bacterium]|jgi:5,10-methylene-tetrahydrofolate dehydrogenase/methenyl tetrahydrofolate cyclohydrolase|nr:bifunctional 5,10-methylenetetrahydrofolate dehydrogenase/5,10-methenyltetrahydrofolate cyclohydrolase [Elusimicrobiota bacterium]